FVDGWPAGRTPFSGELPWGRHTVRVERPGFAAYDTTLTVWKTTNSDGAVIVEVVEGALRREAGWLRVRSGPSGAEVRLDGVAVGQTPLDLLVPPGAYEVEVSGPHVLQSRRVDVGAGENET